MNIDENNYSELLAPNAGNIVVKNSQKNGNSKGKFAETNSICAKSKFLFKTIFCWLLTRCNPNCYNVVTSFLLSIALAASQDKKYKKMLEDEIKENEPTDMNHSHCCAHDKEDSDFEISSEYSDDEDVPPFRNGIKVWDYFYITKEDLIKGLSEVRTIYARRCNNSGDLFQLFVRGYGQQELTFRSTNYVRLLGFVATSIINKFLSQYGLPDKTIFYHKVKGRFVHNKGKPPKVELMYVDEIQKARLSLCKEVIVKRPNGKFRKILKTVKRRQATKQ